MTKEFNEVLIGFDLCYEHSLLTFYHQNNTEPMTVSSVAGEEKYQIPTPRDLFPLIEQRAELGTALLSNFFKMSFEKLSSVGSIGNMTVMVTMKKMKPVWAKAIREALEMLSIPGERIYLQDHLESFYYYALSQKKELWHYKVALFEYENDFITGYELYIDFGTKPAFAEVKNRGRICLDKKVRGGKKTEEWNLVKDRLFLQQAKKLIGNDVYSTVYLIGDSFEKSWAQESLAFLCHKKHVFMGKNLFTKGACYGAMNLSGLASIGDFIYYGADMVEHNLGMQMNWRGKESYHNMITAGINYYMAWYECEFILDDTKEIVLYSSSMRGEKASYTIELGDLPKRPNKATRIHMQITFTGKNKCKVRLDDLGLGELYKSSGKKWEQVIEL